MRHLILLVLAALATSAHAAPVPLEEILSTPAGRWLVGELRLTTSTTSGAARGERLLQERFVQIRDRYRKSVSRTDGAFRAGGVAELAADKWVVLDMIATEEMENAVRFVDDAVTESFAARRDTFLATPEYTPVLEFQRFGRFTQADGTEMTLVGRNARASQRLTQPWQDACAKLLRLFGVRPIIRSIIAVPSVKAVNTWIERLNGVLSTAGKPVIPIRFTEHGLNLGRSGAKMLAKGQVPLLLHSDRIGSDPVTMLGSILVTDSQLAIHRADVSFLEYFEGHFWRHAGSAEGPYELRKAFNEVWEILGRRAGGNPDLHDSALSPVMSFHNVGWDLARGGEQSWTTTMRNSPFERIRDLFWKVPVLRNSASLRTDLLTALEAFSQNEGQYFNRSVSGMAESESRAAFATRLEELKRAAEELGVGIER